MVTYTVLMPQDAPASRLESAEELTFVKDGFNWLAALVPAIWLLAKRMWLALIAFIAIAGLVVWLFTSAGTPQIGNAILFIIQIIFGFEAGALYSADLERRGWVRVGTVSGRNSEDAERRFLEAWLPTHTDIPPASAAADFAPRGDSPSWAQTALAQARDAVDRARRALARA